jgi:hypothetical protein
MEKRTEESERLETGCYQIVKFESTRCFYIRLAGLYLAGFDAGESRWGRENDSKPFDTELAARTQIQLLRRKREPGDDSQLLELISLWKEIYPSSDVESALILARSCYQKCEEDQGLR